MAAKPVAADPAELDRLRGEHEELMRLRGQVNQLRRQFEEQPKAQSRPASVKNGRFDLKERRKLLLGDRLAVEEENARTLLAKSPEIPMIAADSWNNARHATPTGSLQTLNWAMGNYQTNAVVRSLGMNPETRQLAESVFAGLPEPIRQLYGNVDALLLDWRLNYGDSPSAYRVLSQREFGSNDASLTVQIEYGEGIVREEEMQFYRDEGGGWRQLIPRQIIQNLPEIANELAPRHVPKRQID